jgi:predicted permease
MIRNYLKTALRVIHRNKAFSVINILGFSVGLISCLVIFLFIKHELSFDKHIPDYKKVFRIATQSYENEGIEKDASVPYPLTNVLKEETTGYVSIAPIFYAHEPSLKYKNKRFKEHGVTFTDERFVDMFGVKMLSGNAESLNHPGNVLISEKLADKLFGRTDPTGKTLTLEQDLHLQVAGLIKESPGNTHLPYKMLVSMESLNEKVTGLPYQNWGSRIGGMSTYIKLKRSKDKDSYEKQIREVIRKSGEQDENDNTTYFLQPVSDIHLDPSISSFLGAYTTSKKFIWIFISVGLFILVIAGINFINLSTVQAIKRTREIGVRKVLGADRLKIIRQFFGETLLLLLAAEIVALIMAEVILPRVSSFLGSNIDLNLYGDLSVILFMLSILIGFGLIAGIYPALFLSRYNPLQAIRSKSGQTGKKPMPVFGTLVVFQFFISQVLIISSVIVGQQIDFFKTKDLGFDRENVMMINLYGQDNRHQEAFEQELLQIPEVEKVSFGLGAPLSNSIIMSNAYLPGKKEQQHSVNVKTVDASYLDFYDIDLLAGRIFNEQSAGDTVHHILINKKLANDLGYDSLQNALGKRLRCFGGTNEITGVISDFHTQSLHGSITGTVLMYMPRWLITASVKFRTGQNQAAIKKVRSAWDRIYPQQVFDYAFLEDEIMEEYQDEERTSQVIRVFSVVAIIIAILGLYGMVSFMMVHRTREIGIRKTQGATTTSIIRLLSGNYLKYILIAGLLAWPVAWYLMERWLQDFAYHINLHIVYFIASTLLLLLISLGGILQQTIKTAHTNPAESLRTE